MYLLDLFEGRREKKRFGLVCGAPLDYWTNAGLCWCFIHVQ